MTYISHRHLQVEAYKDVDWVGSVNDKTFYFRLLYICGRKFDHLEEQETSSDIPDLVQKLNSDS